MFYISEMNDSLLKNRIEYDMREYLKDKNNGEYEELKEILLQYYNQIKQYIMEEITEKDLIMKDNKAIRHDLDITSHVNFEKIRQSIYTKSNKELSYFEKKAKTVILLNAIEMINIYGIEQLRNNQQNVEKEITYGTFLDRKMKKTNDEIEAFNKIGDMYGKESIKYYKDIFLLEERVNSLLSLNCTTQEKEKLESILNRVNEIINFLPKDIRVVLQLRTAKTKINEKLSQADNCWMDSPDINSLKKVKEQIQKQIDEITEKHKRILEKNRRLLKLCIDNNIELDIDNIDRIENIIKRDLKNTEKDKNLARYFEQIIRKIRSGTDVNLNKSGWENEIEKYNASMKIIDYYHNKLKSILIETQNNNSDEIENDAISKELKNAYEEYWQVNREMLINRLHEKAPSVINSADENKFMLVHFPTSESAIEGNEEIKDTDGINLENRIMRVLRAKVAKQNGRKYNRKKDRQDVKELYKKSRNLFDFTHRIPVKIQFLANSLFVQDTTNDENPYQETYYMCLTKPTTNISMTIAKPGKLIPHRDRKIGYGCFKSSVSPEAIYSIDIGFNLTNDIHIFEEDEYPISELEFGTQETMVDWTKIKPDYIIVIKDTKDFENSDIYMKAKEMSEQAKLPLVIYDQYEIDRKKESEMIR